MEEVIDARQWFKSKQTCQQQQKKLRNMFKQMRKIQPTSMKLQKQYDQLTQAIGLDDAMNQDVFFEIVNTQPKNVKTKKTKNKLMDIPYQINNFSRSSFNERKQNRKQLNESIFEKNRERYLNIHEQRVNNMGKYIQQKNHAIQVMQNELRTIKQKLQRAGDDVNHMNNQIMKRETQIYRLNAQISQQKQRNIIQNDVKQKTINQQATKIDNAMKEIEYYKQKLTYYTLQIEKYEQKSQQLMKQHAIVMNQVNALKIQLGNQITKNLLDTQLLGKMNTQLQQQVQREQKMKQNLQQKSNSIKQRMAILQKQTKQLIGDVASKQQIIAATNMLYRQNKAQLIKIANIIEELDKKINEQKNKSIEFMNSIVKRIEKLQKQITMIKQFNKKKQESNNQLMQQQNVKLLLKTGNRQIVLNTKQGKTYIGQRIKTQEQWFYTKHCIWMDQQQKNHIKNRFYQGKNIFKGDDKIIMRFPGSRIAWIFDQYKGKLFAGLRMINWYNKQPQPTKNGINFTFDQAQKICEQL